MAPREVQQYYDFVARGVAQGLALERKSQSSHVREDIFHFLCTATDPNTGAPAYSLEELLAETHLLIIAGRDTTATTISALFFYICRDPRVYNKLTREIRTTFTSAEEIRPGPALTSSTYLRACIDEALRMAPPGPSEFPRVVLRGGMSIDGEYYPEGVVVGTAGWANGHSEEFYGDANTYRPERWLVSEENDITADEVARLKNGFNPFLKGSGSCIGQHIAITELMMLLGRTLFRMDVRIVPGSALGEGNPSLGWGRRLGNQFQLRDAYMAIREGPLVQFRKRVI